jgi:hypothetical protein
MHAIWPLPSVEHAAGRVTRTTRGELGRRVSTDALTIIMRGQVGYGGREEPDNPRSSSSPITSSARPPYKD